MEKSIREITEQIISNITDEYSIELKRISVTHAFRENLVFWETRLKPWLNEQEYLSAICEIMEKAGHSVSEKYAKYLLSEVAKEIGFDRKKCKLDGRRKLRKGGKK